MPNPPVAADLVQRQSDAWDASTAAMAALEAAQHRGAPEGEIARLKEADAAAAREACAATDAIKSYPERSLEDVRVKLAYLAGFLEGTDYIGYGQEMMQGIIADIRRISGGEA